MNVIYVLDIIKNNTPSERDLKQSDLLLGLSSQSPTLFSHISSVFSEYLNFNVCT